MQRKASLKVIIWWCYRRKHLIGKFSPDTSASYSEQSTTIYYKYHDFLKLGHSQFGQKSISSMISPLQSRVADPAGAEPDPYFKKLSNSNMVLPSEIKLMYCPTYDRVSKDQLHWLLFLQRTNLDPGHFSRVVSGSAFLGGGNRIQAEIHSDPQPCSKKGLSPYRCYTRENNST